MARTSAKAKKQKQDVNKTKSESADTNESEKPEEKSASANDNENTNGSTDKENDTSNYEVEKIVHSRVYHGKRQFLVRWKGYKEDSDTWENESVLQSCSEVLEAFKEDNPKLIEKSKDESDNEVEKESDTEKGKKRTKQESKKAESKKLKKSAEVTSDNEDQKESDTEDDKGNKKVGKGTKKVLAKSKQKVKESRKKSKQSENDDDDDDSSESVTDKTNYEVEKILEVHTRKNGSREFLIRWKGYRPSDDTWEPEEHLDCPDLIEKFMSRVDKAKSVPARELRETRTPTNRYVPTNRGQQRSNLRQCSVRPFYQE